MLNNFNFVHNYQTCLKTCAKCVTFGFSADSSNENPYEDIELESQCSQQSLPSSPGADTAKVKVYPELEAATIWFQ